MKLLPLLAIRTDGGTQSRDAISPEVVREYSELMASGGTLPAPIVFFDGKAYWLADGFHRVAAARDAKLDAIMCDVRQGARRDATLFSVGANGKHGLRRTGADKRRAVLMLLGDEEWSRKSDSWIADKCVVSGRFVGMIRAEQAPTMNGSELRESRDGKTRDVSKIGKTKATRAAAAPELPISAPANDDEDAEVADDDLDVVDVADDPSPALAPDRDDRRWEPMDLSTAIVRYIAWVRDLRADAARRFDEVDPRFRDEFTRRVEDATLTTIEALMDRLPVDARRAERNRSRFQVLTGGK